jgi:DNA-binding response OmpR family regulator
VGGLAKRKTVLVVEDDRSTSDMLRTFVEGQGFRFVPANEGHLVLELACEERPSLITLDLDLPDTDGHAVLHRLLSDDRTRDIPIVVVSGYSHFLPPSDGRRIAAVMTKPLDLDGLADVMRTVLATDRVR